MCRTGLVRIVMSVQKYDKGYLAILPIKSYLKRCDRNYMFCDETFLRLRN